MRKLFLTTAILTLAAIAIIGWFWPPMLWSLVVALPLAALGIADMVQTRHTILRNFPLIGRGRRIMEAIRPMVQQYFVESDVDSTPVSRMFRSVVYQRAKCEMDTVPYGTKVDVYRIGYEWLGHSLGAHDLADINPDLRVLVGGADCSQPYHASLLNISAMSYGALGRNAVLTLNAGAARGGFAHNTGEGGLSPYHLQHGGDIIWQIGTAYFGCRDRRGRFDEQLFGEKASLTQVKMIEIKLSQGAKPGHGGVLPECKNTPEIAEIRGVEPYTRVDSPAVHSTFSTPLEMMAFIRRLRELSGSKPVGIKLCVGRKSEIIALCKAMVETGIKPDFITVDGGEGGTGAAPLEYTNSVGMPLTDALAFVSDCLTGFGLKSEIKIVASGKIFTGFHIIKRLSLGADLCASARGMMLAMGCIQSLQCNSNRCPTGITTHNPSLMVGLVVADKSVRVANFHRETLESAAELLAATGLSSPAELNRSHIYRRISQTQVARYDEIYPPLAPGCLLGDAPPEVFGNHLLEADANSFKPRRRTASLG